LITLGIIGVVAALTMPALTANYQKKVLETRIKKFYSVLNQAANAKIADDGALDFSMMTGKSNSPDVALEFFEVNYAPYMKTLKLEKTGKGLAAALPDGSGMYLRDHGNNIHIHFCVYYKACKDIDETVDSWRADGNGKDKFLFYPTGAVPMPGWDGTRAMLMGNCNGTLNGGNRGWCSSLLRYDGWEIKDDYPWL
jgi:type II secretory pathway pseudopilin PulG